MNRAAPLPVCLSICVQRAALKAPPPFGRTLSFQNPIKLVRQSAKREKVPEILELSELQKLLGKLAVRERTLVLLDAATGLRVSELLALRWDDIDFENLEIRVTESIWHQVLGVCKTEASAKPVPNLGTNDSGEVVQNAS